MLVSSVSMCHRVYADCRSGSSFDKFTDFSQLVMVPLQNTHAANGIVEPDRMLWISGTLSDPSFGNASSALFDGQQIIPYIVSTTSSGDPGIIASLFHSFSTFSFTQRRKYSLPSSETSKLTVYSQTSWRLALLFSSPSPSPPASSFCSA